MPSLQIEKHGKSWIKLSKDIKLTIVKSYILSKLDYCNALYYGINQSHIDKLQSVMNAAMRFINSVHGRNWKTPGTTHQLCRSIH